MSLSSSEKPIPNNTSLTEASDIAQTAREKYERQKQNVKDTTRAKLLEISGNLPAQVELLRDSNPKSKEEAGLIALAIEKGLWIKGSSIASVFNPASLSTLRVIPLNDGVYSVKTETGNQVANTFTDALTLLQNSSNQIDKETAEALRFGMSIYDAMNETSHTLEDGDKFNENKELLTKLQNGIPNMWLPAVELGLTALPSEFGAIPLEEVYFSYTNGAYRARTIRLIGVDTFYDFDTKNGWISANDHRLTLSLTPIYTAQPNGTYTMNPEAVAEFTQLQLPPLSALTHVLNTHTLSDNLFSAILLEHPFPIPFPAIEKMDLQFDTANRSASQSQLEAHIYKAYTMLLAGVDPDACKKFSAFLAKTTIDTLLTGAKDDKGKALDPSEKYSISCEELENLDSIINPARFKIERSLSTEAIAKIEELESWKDKIKNSILAKIPLVGAGAAFIPMIGELMDSALSTVWGDIEAMGEEWAQLETEKGEKLSLFAFIGASATGALSKKIKKEPQDEGSFFGRLFGRSKSSDSESTGGSTVQERQQQSAYYVPPAPSDEELDEETPEFTSETQELIDNKFKKKEVTGKPTVYQYKENEPYEIENNRKLVFAVKDVPAGAKIKIDKREFEVEAGAKRMDDFEKFMKDNKRFEGGKYFFLADDSFSGEIEFTDLKLEDA